MSDKLPLIPQNITTLMCYVLTRMNHIFFELCIPCLYNMNPLGARGFIDQKEHCYVISKKTVSLQGLSNRPNEKPWVRDVEPRAGFEPATFRLLGGSYKADAFQLSRLSLPG